VGGHDDCRVEPDRPGNCAPTRHEPSADPRGPPGRVSQRSAHLIVSAWPRSRFSRHSNSSAESPSLRWRLATIHSPRAPRHRPEMGSFSGSIPPSFVLSHNMPMTNTTSNWLCSGAFLSLSCLSLQFHWLLATGHWPLFSCRWPLSSRPTPFAPPSTPHDRRGPPSMPRAEPGTAPPPGGGQHATTCYVQVSR